MVVLGLVLAWAIPALAIVNVTADDTAWKRGVLIAALWPVALPIAALIGASSL